MHLSAPRGILPPATSILSRLSLAFVAVVLVPALAIGIASATSSWKIGRQRTLDQLASVLRLKSAEIDLWTNALAVDLDLFSRERDLSEAIIPYLRGQLSVSETTRVHARLTSDMDQMKSKTGVFSCVWLMDSAGRVIVSTDQGQEGQNLSGTGYYQQGLQQNFISPPFRSESPDRRMIIVAAHPIIMPGQGAVGILAGYCDISFLDRIMAEPAGLGQTGTSFLIGADFTGLTTLSSQDNQSKAPIRSDEGVRRAVEDRVEGQGLYRDFRNVPVLGVYAWLPILKVALVVEQSQEEAFRPFAEIVLINVVVALIAIILALLAATFVTRGIARPLVTLSATATRIAAGDLDQVVTLHRQDEIGELAKAFNHMTGRLRLTIVELQTELTERQRAEAELRASEERLRESEAQIRKSLSEKETLLRELHHRTKNNMGVIIALLELQALDIDDARLNDAIAETTGRIRSMALVHQKLYEARDLSHINLREYIEELALLLTASYLVPPARLSTIHELEDISVLIDTAIPCGLILNELISNALKYAFPGGRKGEIRLELRKLEGGEIRLRVSDDGVGLPEGFDPGRTDTWDSRPSSNWASDS
jgi:two-component sensor histidine kinase/HAMP domain-containing protein